MPTEIKISLEDSLTLYRATPDERVKLLTLMWERKEITPEHLLDYLILPEDSGDTFAHSIIKDAVLFTSLLLLINKLPDKNKMSFLSLRNSEGDTLAEGLLYHAQFALLNSIFDMLEHLPDLMQKDWLDPNNFDGSKIKFWEECTFDVDDALACIQQLPEGVKHFFLSYCLYHSDEKDLETYFDYIETLPGSSQERILMIKSSGQQHFLCSKLAEKTDLELFLRVLGLLSAMPVDATLGMGIALKTVLNQRTSFLDEWNPKCQEVLKCFSENCDESEQHTIATEMQLNPLALIKMTEATLFSLFGFLGETKMSDKKARQLVCTTESNKEALADYLVDYVKQLDNADELLSIRQMLNSPESALVHYLSSQTETETKPSSFWSCAACAPVLESKSQYIRKVQVAINDVLPPPNEGAMERDILISGTPQAMYSDVNIRRRGRANTLSDVPEDFGAGLGSGY
jgi:hypothetical protein